MKHVFAHLDDLAGLDVLHARGAAPWPDLEQHQPSGLPALKAFGRRLVTALRRNRASDPAADARAPAAQG